MLAVARAYLRHVVAHDGAGGKGIRPLAYFTVGAGSAESVPAIS